MNPTTVQAELVEALPCLAPFEKGQPFDELRVIG
jgi:hypothetical protein